MTGSSLDIKQAQVEKLKELFPESVAEGKIDWEKLRLTLGEELILQNERYVLNWAGKSEAFKAIQTTTTATLKPHKKQSVNFDTTENIFIEGENLEVLKVLQKSYYGKIKMIYIDQPYNTGNDSFIYPDKFSESKEEYLKRIGDKDEAGYLTKEGFFRKNSKENGQYHSNWLSMMYPRLFLARNLLREDGVIFVSIDDNEVHNLRLLMNEIFGEENFVAQVIWHSKYTTANDAKYISVQHESVLIYAKIFKLFDIGLLDRTTTMDEAYKNPDNDPRGGWKATPLHAKSGSNIYEVTFDNGVTWKPPKGRYPAFTKEKLLQLYYDNRISFGRNGKSTPNLKTFLTEVKQGKTVGSVWSFKDVGSTHEANEEFASLISKGIFDNPKPCSLLRRCIKISNAKYNDIVLDFFAGSGTTAQAVFELNKEDNGNRKFILVQLPEKTDEESGAYKAGYKTIADICKERIRRVIDKIKNEELRVKNEKQEKLTLGEPSSAKEIDLGFKCYTLEPSNFKIWRTDTIDTVEELKNQMDAFVDPVRSRSEAENMAWEIMLKSGYELTTKMETIKLGESSTPDRQSPVFSIADGEMILALENITQEAIYSIIAKKPKRVIMLDRLFADNDQLKTNTALQMKDAGIDFRTI